MTIEQMRARLALIVATLGEINNSADISDEQVAQVNDLNAEFESLTSKIEAREKIENMSARASVSTRKTVATPIENAARIDVGQNRIEADPKRGFRNSGEFFLAVKNKAPSLQAAGLQEKFGEDGGYLIPEDFRQDLQKKVQGDQSLLMRTTRLSTNSNNVSLPTYEVAPWDSAAGFQAYWDGEAKQMTASKTAFGQMSMRLHKLTALVPVTDEVLEDAPLLDSWIRANAPEALLNKVNSAIISGSGVGMPQGFLNSGFKKQIAKESSQTADTVVYKNIQKMYAALVPSSIPFAAWLINPQVIPQLQNMVFDTASAIPLPVYMPPTGVVGAPYGSLYGLPIIPMMGGVKALGDEGDISLVDLRYMLTAMKTMGDGFGVKQDISTHVYFDTNETAYRFIMRMAGQCPFKSVITNEAGDYQASGFVTLADRA